MSNGVDRERGCEAAGRGGGGGEGLARELCMAYRVVRREEEKAHFSLK